MVADEIIIPKSYGERVEQSLLGFIVGIILLVTVPIFLWLVERQVARYALMLKRCRIATREIPASDIASPDNTNRPILVKGYTRRSGDNDCLTDAETGYHGPDTTTIHRPVIKKELIRLMRRVEMFQWVELQSMEDNRTVYTYTQRWSQYDQNSQMFQRPEQHENPPSRVPPLYTTTFNAKDVAVGVYLLNDVQVNMLTTWEPCHIQHLPKDVYSFTDMLGQSLNPHLETSTDTTTDIFEVAASLSPSLMGSYASSGSLTATDVIADTKPHHKRPKPPTDYIVFNGSLTNPSIGTVRICYYMVLSGGPVTTLAVQVPMPHIPPPNFFPFDKERIFSSNGDTGNSAGAKVEEWNEATAMDLDKDGENNVDSKADVEEEEGGIRTPSMSVQFTFRPFNEEDAHRTLAWGLLCCGSKTIIMGEEGGPRESGGYGRYVYAPNSGSFSNMTTQSSTSVNKIGSSSPQSNFKGQQHEYQSLDSSIEAPAMSPMCCNLLDCDACCPVINYCAGKVVGTDVTLLEERFASKEAMFHDKLKEFTWKISIVRLASYLMLSIAFFLILKPVASTLSFLPFIGTLLLNFFWIAALLAGFVLGIIISTLAWVLFRPQLLAGLFIVLGGILFFIERNPESYEQREVARALKVTGSVLLILSLLPLSLGIYQMVEEHRFRQLQDALDVQHNKHTHRHNTHMTSNYQQSIQEDDDVRSRDSQALTQFAAAGEKSSKKGLYKDHVEDRRGQEQWTRQPSSGSNTISNRVSSGNGSRCPVATESTHLLAQNRKNKVDICDDSRV